MELLSRSPGVYVAGIADPNQDASGMKLAQSLGIATSVDFKTFLSNPGLNQVINVTGSVHVQRELEQYAPAGVEIIGGSSARLMWEIMETHKESGTAGEPAQMKASLQSSSRQLMETLNFLPDPMFVIDEKGIIIVWNREMEILTGFLSRDMIGKGAYEYALPFYGERRPILVDLAVHADPEIEKRYSNLKKEGNVLAGETYITLPCTGKTHYVWAAAAALFDNNGNIMGGIEIIRDITERKKMEDTLRESEEKYRAFFETSQDSVFITSTEGRPIDCNDAAVKLLGYESREDILNVRSIAELYERPAERDKHIELIMRDGFSKDYAVNLRRKDGKILSTLVTAAVKRDKEGRVTGFQGTIRDMTAYKKAEEGLKESHERFQVVMDSLAALVYVADLETYELLFINKFGIERWGPVTGRLCWQTLRKGQDGPCSSCTNGKLADDQGNPAGIMVWEFQNGPDGKWYQCRDQAIRWIDGRLARLEVAVEITEQRSMQSQLHDKIRDLESFQRLIVGREMKMRELKNRIMELEKILENQ